MSEQTQRKAFYGEAELNLPEGATVEMARASFAALYSEVEEAEARELENGDIIFELRASEKGADEHQRKAFYGEAELDLPEGATAEMARASFAALYSEVEEAEVRELENGDIIFELKASEKG